jgi:hypothetical protein
MRTGALQDAVSAEWGSPRSMQLRQTGRLANLGKGLWGLVDRDLPPAADTDAAVSIALAAFRSGIRNVGEIHALMASRGEVGGIAGTDALAALLRLRSGLVKGRDGNLRDPQGPVSFLEGSIKGAVLDVLAQATEGLTKPEIVALASAMTGKDVEPSYVSHIVTSHGHPGPGGKWHRHPVQAAPGAGPPTGRAEAPVKRSYPAMRRPPTVKRVGTHWGDNDVETLRRMWAGGSSALAISMALDGRASRCAVLAKIHRLRLGRARGPA